VLKIGIWVIIHAYVSEHVLFLQLPFLIAKIHVNPNTYFTSYYNLEKKDFSVSLFIPMVEILRIKGIRK
jgi:hypothetical protein